MSRHLETLIAWGIRKLFFELGIIFFGDINGCGSKDRIEASKPSFLQFIEAIALGFLIEMLADITHDIRETIRRRKHRFAVNIADLLVFYIFRFAHRRNIINLKRQNVLIIDSVDDGIGMQLFTESLFGGL